MKKTILIVDDEKDIVDLLSYNLQREGYNILTAHNGKEALIKAELKPDLIILDIMLPEYDGLYVLKKLKENELTAKIPVIFLTAKSSEIDEVVGLELGADDYIVKPISLPKLKARIKNVFRKEFKEKNEQNVINFGNIEVFPEQYLIKIDNKNVYFTNKEFQIILYLIKHVGKVVDRETLLKKIWGEDVYVIDRTIDVHIRRIREKFGKYSNYIETIKNVGYRLKELE